MAIPAGTRFGPYEILAALGAGGMGEVYRARDMRLQREVAVKVLPAGVSSDPERLKRFEKEARSASSLNHPNIVVVYDIGEAAGASFIAMELVEGQTIRELLAEGALPTKKVLAIAAQVADGLAKAHGAGIVHRDLKPENIMVTREGFAKILDFGLAKLTQMEGSEHATKAPTVSGATEPGLVMGTIGYMSPEQALAKPVDFRSDQFSLGSIVYEMATGKRAFSRGSAPETLTAIIRDEPEPIAGLAPLTPTPLRWIVERCLSKSPEDRYASTRDLARDLSTLKDRLSEATSSGTLSSAVAAPAAHRASKALRASPWILAVLLAAGLSWLLSSGSRTKATPAAPLRFSVTLPAGVALSESDIESHSAISPDGRWLVFVGSSLEKERLYLRPVDSLEARPLAGTEGAITPFWSPDSRSIGFYADGKIQRIAAAGGPPQIICNGGIESLPTWGSADQILFMQLGEKVGGLWVVSASGGEPRRLIAMDAAHGETAQLWPYFLPDGRRFLFITLSSAVDRSRLPLRLGSLDSESAPTIGEVSSRVEYASGHLLFVRGGVLLAQPFDARKPRLTGEPFALAEHVYQFNGPLMAGFSASQTGVVVYEPSTRSSRLSWLNRTGKEVERLPVAGAIRTLRLSPDGRSVALSIDDEKRGSSDIWTYDFERRLSVRVTLDPRDEKNPVWSADGKSIFFRADWMGPPDIFRITARSPDSAAPAVVRPGVQFPEDTSPDGRFLVFTEFMRRTNGDLWLLPLSGGGKPFPLSQAPFDEKGARFSPDSRWLAYYSNESGSREVYLRPVEESGERLRVSSDGGTMPRWRRDGKELYYLAPGNTVMAVPLSTGQPQPGVASSLFRVDGIVRDYDVTADGQRFLVDVAEPDPAPLSVLANWPSLLSR
jgi:serine/threonine protein kinase/Tol biopolymer transport system component